MDDKGKRRMRNLEIPESLKIEFATIEALWKSDATTRRVDALLLSWIKYEKQLRRLFCFLVFQHPNIGQKEIDQMIAVIAANSQLFPETLVAGIQELGVKPVSDLLDTRWTALSTELARIKGYRNKLIHGQMTGLGLTSDRLEKDVIVMVDWIHSLGEAARSEYGYDGVGRNTYRHAKAGGAQIVRKYPFNTPEEFESWLKGLSKKVSTNRKRIEYQDDEVPSQPVAISSTSCNCARVCRGSRR